MTGATCDTANERRIMLLERGHDELKEAVMSLSTSQKSISESLGRLVVLEERHVETRQEQLRQANVQIDIQRQLHEIRMTIPIDAEKRLKGVEVEMPRLIEMRSAIFKVLISIATVVGMALIALVVKVN